MFSLSLWEYKLAIKKKNRETFFFFPESYTRCTFVIIAFFSPIPLPCFSCFLSDITFDTFDLENSSLVCNNEACFVTGVSHRSKG